MTVLNAEIMVHGELQTRGFSIITGNDEGVGCAGSLVSLIKRLFARPKPRNPECELKIRKSVAKLKKESFEFVRTLGTGKPQRNAIDTNRCNNTPWDKGTTCTKPIPVCICE